MHIAFDADDTLWHNESIFNWTQERVAELLADWTPAEALGQRLNIIERRNLDLFGYGSKGFTLSLIETALELSEENVPASVIRQILDYGKAMIEHPVELLPGVRSTLELLGAEHPLLLITKGELFHQETKIARSGLADHFDVIEIVSEKDPETYRRVLASHDIDAARFVMIGNSVKSDVLPVVSIGGQAIHVPYESTWELDMVEHRGADEEGFFVAATMADVPDVIQQIASLGWNTLAD
ncbi:MAG: HAD family hydrolase [Thermoanaerobaculia bacterium]|nr:HAD family hydrolase [Thermoanaerobaculia bacterium]